MEAIVPELTRRTCLAVAGGKDDIRHLPRCDKVNPVGPMPGVRGERLEELPHRTAQHGILIVGIHAVAVKLNEDPLGTTQDADVGPSP